jgi:DNA polymerase V
MLVSDTDRQPYLCEPDVGLTEQQTVAETFDASNREFGGETICYAAGLTPGWKMRQEHRSPRYTTRLNKLPVVK